MIQTNTTSSDHIANRHKLCCGFSSATVANTKYGNHISLIDAMYRTMKYKLFSVCVCKNVGYSVAAQFIVQSEVWNIFQRHVL